MNPNRRRRRSRRLYGAAAAAHAKRVGRRVHRRSRRRVRRNPAVATRRSSPPKMTTAMRAKISRAVKAANRRRAGSGGIRRRMSSVVHSVRRRFSRSKGGFTSSFSGSFKSAFARGTIMKAAGAVSASLGVGFLLSKFGGSLPLATNKYGRIAYYVGIPVLVAFGVNKMTKGKARDFTEGLVIGGLVLGINAAITTAKAATGAMASSPDRVNSMQLAGELGNPRALAYYPQQPGKLGTMMPTGAAFTASAW